MALHLEGLAASWLRGNHGCVRCAHSGLYLQLYCNHSCRPVSRRGMRSGSTLRRHVCILQAATGWTTSSPDSPYSPVAALRKRGRLALSTALHSTSPRVLFHLWLPQLCKIPLMALPRNGYILLPAMSKDDLHSGAFVCRHKAGSWNAVSADQFGEQTAVKIGKGGLKGITLSPEQVAEWIDTFPISAYVSDALDHCFSPDQANSSSETPHKEEGIKRRNVDTDDRRRISEELDKCSHPLEIESDVLYNIVNGQVAPAVVNVSDALSLGALMVTDFGKSLPAGFHAKLSSPVKTMEKLKHGIKIGDQVVFDLESIFLRLLLVGQQREMELLSIFGYEVCAFPPLLVDEYGCLRKGNKAVLMHRLGVKQCQRQRPGVIIVDAQQLLYHVVWPCGGSVGVLAESLKARLALCPATEKSSFSTSMQMNWPRTTRGAGELVLAPPHSTWL